jgi:uncharacterized paraquat-inducible protein A
MADRETSKRPFRDQRSERYEVSDPSVLFEDVWTDDDASSCTEQIRTCPTCGYDADLTEIRCPRCFTLLLTGCSGSCGSCGSRTCAGERRKR